MKRARWVTMQEVADHAKVGKITVSRVLRTPDKVSDSTLKRVQASIAELGYVPDNTAGALSSNQSKVIGALVSTLNDSVFAKTIEGLSRTLRAKGYELLLTSTEYDPALEEEALRTLLGRRPDGLVLTSTSHSEGFLKLLKSSQIPVVEVWQLPSEPLDFAVGFSNVDAGHDMTQFIIRSGRKSIAFLGGHSPLDIRGQRRREGYVSAMRDAELPEICWPEVGSEALSGAELGAVSLGGLLRRYPNLEAVICVSDPVAMGLMCEARRLSVKIPDDLAIAGFGGFELAAPAAFDLTTMAFPGEAIGIRTAEVLLEPNRKDGQKIIDLGYNLIERGTT